MSCSLNKKPRVSVCILTYNQEKYIKDCLLSVLAQSFDVDLEVVVGDDASNDNTSNIVNEIANKYPEIVKVYKHENNLGPKFNCLFVIAKTTGEYIAHLDGDDFWMPGKLQKQVDFLQNHPECAAVYGNGVIINESKEVVGVFNNIQPEIFDLSYLFAKGNFLSNSSLLYRGSFRNLILAEPTTAVDFQFNLRLATKGKLGYLNQMLVAYRVNSEGSSIANRPKIIRNCIYESLLEASEYADVISTVLGYSHFMSEVIYVSLITFEFNYAFLWGRRIAKDKHGVFCIMIFIVAIVMCCYRIIYSEPKKNVLRLITANNFTVLFKR